MLSFSFLHSYVLVSEAFKMASSFCQLYMKSYKKAGKSEKQILGAYRQSESF